MSTINKDEYSTYCGMDTSEFLENYCVYKVGDEGGEECPFAGLPCLKPISPKDMYLTFEVVESGTITMRASNTSVTKTVSYSTDKGNTWTDLTTSTTARALGGTLNVGDKILVKGTNASYGTSSYYNQFGGTAKVKVYGNIMSLIYGDDFASNDTLSQERTFYQLFYNYANLLSADKLILPATTLADRCYQGMFGRCASLTITPELPSTTVSASAYTSMFSGCTSLTKAPALPATTLTPNCYDSMFDSCTSLTTTPELPATTLANNCYSFMFYGCTSLTTTPELPATTLANNCYNGMFNGCTSLTTAPELPATTLADLCYQYMFQGCTSLTTAPELPATTLTPYCYGSMFYGCTNLTTAPELPATTLAKNCYNGMFNGCTSLTTAPELLATTLAEGCYGSIFYGCTNLNYIKAMFTTTPNINYTNGWVSGVASSGTFVKNSAATWNVSGVNGIPNGWTVETASS